MVWKPLRGAAAGESGWAGGLLGVEGEACARECAGQEVSGWEAVDSTPEEGHAVIW